VKKGYIFTHTLKMTCINKSRKNTTEAFKLHALSTKMLEYKDAWTL